ncbi:hypothetical protein [Holospora obtusa]|uniref:hypothetical protein n=1 Tax=Holospora obtusa TaxID=49893 RepID=UPI0012EBE4E0|nr:hypothetical protein [Holospora obtusa]
MSFIATILKKKEKQIAADVSGEKNQQTSSNLNSFSSEIAKKFLASWNLEKFGEKESHFFCRLIVTFKFLEKNISINKFKKLWPENDI